MVRDAPGARDKPTDPQPRGKSKDGRSLTSSVTITFLIPPPPPLRHVGPDPPLNYSHPRVKVTIDGA